MIEAQARNAPDALTAVAGGRRLRVWRRKAAGPYSIAPPLLFLHGGAYSSLPMFDWGGDTGSYSLMRATALQGVAAYALDFAGYGESREVPETPQDLDAFVGDSSAAVDMVERDTGTRPIVVGWSWGAQVAAALATRTSLAGLVFWGGVWGQRAADVPSPLRGLAKPDDRYRINTLEHAASDFITPQLYEQTVPERVARAALSADPRVPSDARNAFLAGLPLFAAEDIRCPVLIVSGDGDPLVSEDDVCRMSEATPTPVSRVVIRGAEHAAQFSMERKGLVDALVSFAKNGPIRERA